MNQQYDQTQAIQETSGVEPSQEKQNYYNMVDQANYWKTEMNTPSTKSGMASNYAIMAYMVSVNSMYGAEMQTNQVRLLQDEQDLSTAMSKLLTDLQNVEKDGLAYNTNDGKNKPVWSNGKIQGQNNVISQDDVKVIKDDWKNVRTILGMNGTDKDGCITQDAEKYFTNPNIIDSFNSMLSQAQVEINSIYNCNVQISDGSTHKLGDLFANTNIDNGSTTGLANLTDGLNYMAYVHAAYNDSTTGAPSWSSDYPDNLDKAINGGLNGVPGTDPKSNGTQQSGLGLYNEVHVELDQDMTELQNDISQITAMLQQNNDANVDMTKSLEQFQLATAQGVVK